MSTLTNEDIDRQCAERVMGWLDVAPCYGGESDAVANFSPTTNPSDDYRVLARVRKTWDLLSRGLFESWLHNTYCDRAFDLPSQQYRPGDYARAALAALEDQ